MLIVANYDYDDIYNNGYDYQLWQFRLIISKYIWLGNRSQVMVIQSVDEGDIRVVVDHDDVDDDALWVCLC